MGRRKIDDGVCNPVSIRVSDELLRQIDWACRDRSKPGFIFSRNDLIREAIWELLRRDYPENKAKDIE